MYLIRENCPPKENQSAITRRRIDEFRTNRSLQYTPNSIILNNLQKGDIKEEAFIGEVGVQLDLGKLIRF